VESRKNQQARKWGGLLHNVGSCIDSGVKRIKGNDFKEIIGLGLGQSFSHIFQILISTQGRRVQEFDSVRYLQTHANVIMHPPGTPCDAPRTQTQRDDEAKLFTHQLTVDDRLCSASILTNNDVVLVGIKLLSAGKDSRVTRCEGAATVEDVLGVSTQVFAGGEDIVVVLKLKC